MPVLFNFIALLIINFNSLDTRLIKQNKTYRTTSKNLRNYTLMSTKCQSQQNSNTRSSLHQTYDRRDIQPTNASAQYKGRRQTALLLRLAFQVWKPPFGKLRLRSATFGTATWLFSFFLYGLTTYDICYLCTRV